MHIVVNYPCLSPSKRKKVEQAHLLSLYCPKVSQSSPPAGGESSGIIFSGGVYVGENTARLANVRRVRRRRALRAMQRAAAFSNESPVKRVSFESLSKTLF